MREDNVPKNQTYVYTYDNSGNLTSKKIYSLTAQSSTPSGTSTTKSYSYSTTTWGDLLTMYSGGNITYDSIGNPTRYYDAKTFTWEGRRLVGAVSGSTSMSFTYNDEGMRTSKTVAGVTTNYYYNGSQLISEETNGKVKVYLYNSTGVIGFRYRTSSYGTYTWDTFFYEKNLQGDITAVYSSTGVKKISYTYDAWGNAVTTYYNGASATNLANPFTYRGYYYDTDLGLYYLNSRYYDSNTGRFISPDAVGYLGASGDFNSYNLYCYCSNNPVMFADPSGYFIVSVSALLTALVIGAALGAGISFGTTVYQDYSDDGEIFNGSVKVDQYIGNTVEGLVAGAGLGTCTILGAAAGTAILTGTAATLFTAGGVTITMNTALSIGMSTAFVTGMAGYALNTAINSRETFNTKSMLVEGSTNAVSGALSVFSGYLGGVSGLRINLATKLLSRKSDIVKRIVLENIFPGAVKIYGIKRGK